MPTGVLPIQPYYGSQFDAEKPEFTREYDDGSYDWYQKAAGIKVYWVFKFSTLNKTQRDALYAFWVAHKNGSTREAREFYFYDPDARDDPDLTGSDATGRHVGVFLDPGISFPFDGPCRYSTTLRIKQVS